MARSRKMRVSVFGGGCWGERREICRVRGPTREPQMQFMPLPEVERREKKRKKGLCSSYVGAVKKPPFFRNAKNRGPKALFMFLLLPREQR